MSAALDYHRATNVEAGGSDEDLERTLDTHPILFKAYREAERVPLDVTAAGPILGNGAAVLGTATHYGAPGKRTVHFRGYSSAGALYPIEAYVATPDVLYSFDAHSASSSGCATVTFARTLLRRSMQAATRSSS